MNYMVVYHRLFKIIVYYELHDCVLWTTRSCIINYMGRVSWSIWSFTRIFQDHRLSLATWSYIMNYIIMYHKLHTIVYHHLYDRLLGLFKTVVYHELTIVHHFLHDCVSWLFRRRITRTHVIDVDTTNTIVYHILHVHVSWSFKEELHALHVTD